MKNMAFTVYLVYNIRCLFVEVKYSTMFKSTWGAEEEYDDIGGLSIAGGLRF